MPLVSIRTIAIRSAPYVGQRVYVEGKTPGRVVVVAHGEKLVAVRTEAGELVPVPFSLLEVEDLG